jgi:hypothetical protein
MKKHAHHKRQQAAADEMRAEYPFDYAKAKPNRFASRMEKGAVAVILDPDVASVFRSSDAVNTFLRSVIAAMSEGKHKRTKAG